MEGFFYDKPVSRTVFEPDFTPGLETGPIENLIAAGSRTLRSDTSVARGRNLQDVYDPIIASLNQGRKRGEMLANPFGRTVEDPQTGPMQRRKFPPEELEARIYQELRERQIEDPTFGQDFPQSAEAAREAAKDLAKEAIKTAEDVGARATLMGDVAGFAGSMGAIMTDPAVFVTLPIGGVAAPSGILRVAIVEALLGAGSEAVIQPVVQAYKQELGVEHTDEDVLRNILLAGAGGFLLGGGGAGLAKISPKFATAAREAGAISGRKLLETFDRLVPKPSAEQRAARDELENGLQTEESNPLPETGAGRTEHESRLTEAVDAADAAEPVRMTDGPRVAPKVPDSAEIDNLDGLIHKFEPDALGVDARLFQFKSQGDEFGVSDRLAGITEWDPVKAGQVVVYEFRDGRRFIVDGHQRVALAKRIAAQDPGQKPVLFGQLLREADDVTPEMARVVAAAKNIAEGTGSAVDAAKVFRVAPERIAELPISSGLVRTARDLANLSDENFGLVVNEIVTPGHAAVVGRLVPDDAQLQQAILNVLAKTEPANAVQAEAIVRQALAAGTRRETQQTLFGEEELARSLFGERAKVLDLAMKRLRKERGVFATLNRNRSAIEAEGNQLDAAANARRETENAQATQTLQVLANRKGPLSEALTAAATRAFNDRNFRGAVDDFVDAIRGAVARGDFDGASVRADGGDLDVAAEARSGPDRPGPGAEQERLTEFTEPGGEGQASQAAVLEADVRREFGLEDAADDDAILRRDLMRRIEDGAPVDELNAHPAIERALAAMDAVPETLPPNVLPDEAFRESRVFSFAGREVVGYDAALERLAENGRRFSTEGPVRTDRTAAIVIGPPAAGKSFIAERLTAQRFAALVDPDEAKKVLPEYQGGIGANAVHEESSFLMAEQLQRHIEAGENIVIPKVGGGVAKIRRLIGNLQEQGYTVDLVNMAVDPQEAYRRMLMRFVNTGRIINPEYVASVADKPSKTYISLRDERVANGYANIDNNGPRDPGPRVLEDTGAVAEAFGSGGSRGPAPRPDVSAASREAAEAQDLTSPDIDALSEAGDLMEIPVAQRVDPDTGQVVAETRTARELIEDIEDDAAFVEQLDLCAGANVGAAA